MEEGEKEREGKGESKRRGMRKIEKNGYLERGGG